MSVDGYVRTILRRVPTPPRSVTYRAVLGAVLRSTFGLAVGICVPLLVIAGSGALWAADGQVSYVFAGWMLIIACLIVLILVTYSSRIRGALARGLEVEATVIHLDKAEGPGRRTMDAMANGFVAGLRRVRHPLGEFEERFQYDGRGASSLRVGSQMLVLIDPDRRRVLLTVGIRDRPIASMR